MSDSGGKLPAAAAVGRVALTVTNLDTVTTFYEDVVGLRVHRRGNDSTVLGDGETPLLVLESDETAPERGRSEAGLFHTAIRVPSRAALGDALTRIESAAGLDGASDHLVSEALYLSDPEGNGVEVYRDRPRSDWETTADGGVKMATEPLALDPLREAAAGESSVPTGTDVGHVHLEVTSLDTARAFYADALGMNVRTTYDGALFMAAGEYHHHVGANVWRGRSEPAGGRGLAWFELVLPDEASLSATRQRLDDADYDVRRTDETLLVEDEDGIELRLRC